MPVRLGTPQFVTGLTEVINNPVYATGVGLLIYGLQQREHQQDPAIQPNLKGLWGRMKGWFQGNF
jgi:cell division protein FtsA